MKEGCSSPIMDSMTMKINQEKSKESNSTTCKDLVSKNDPEPTKKLVERLEKSKSYIEIHEKCLEDADKRAETLEKSNQILLRENGKLKNQNMELIKANEELTTRLESGATHYR